MASVKMGFAVGKSVKLLTPKFEGKLGVLAKHNPDLNWWHVTLDQNKNDPVYSKLTYGPFTEEELELVDEH